MSNIKVPEFKLQLGEKEYTFRLDFNALMKFDEKYQHEEDKDGNVVSKDALVIFNEFLRGVDTYRNVLKILSCACVEKEWKEEELASLLSFDFKTMKLIDEIVVVLIDGVISESKGGEKNE